MEQALTDKGAPITVPEGPVDPALRRRIEQALDATIPEGRRFAAVSLFDLTGKELDTQLAVRVGGGPESKAEFKLVLQHQWNPKGMSGFVGVAGSF